MTALPEERLGQLRVAKLCALVGVERVLVAVAAPAGDPDLYVAPGYAFVGTDGRRYCRPAALMMPWLAAARAG